MMRTCRECNCESPDKMFYSQRQICKTCFNKHRYQREKNFEESLQTMRDNESKNFNTMFYESVKDNVKRAKTVWGAITHSGYSPLTEDEIMQYAGRKTVSYSFLVRNNLIEKPNK